MAISRKLAARNRHVGLVWADCGYYVVRTHARSAVVAHDPDPFERAAIGEDHPKFTRSLVAEVNGNRTSPRAGEHRRILPIRLSCSGEGRGRCLDVLHSARRAKVAAGNLGVAATGISAGIQMWSRPGGVMAGGATMTGTVSDGTEVEVIGEAEFLGQKYFQIRESSKEGWVDGRLLELR